MKRLIKSVAASLVVSASILAPIKTFAVTRTVVVIQQPRQSPPTQTSNNSVRGYSSITTRDDSRLYCVNHSVPISSTVKQCTYPSTGRR